MRTLKKISLLFALFFIVGHSMAQMGISATPGFVPNANAILDISSTQKGILIPRMTTTEMNNISGAKPDGLMIYNTTSGRFAFWNGTVWLQLRPSQWEENGTHIYNINTGNVGINSSNPTAPLTIYNSTATSSILQNATTGTTATDGLQFGIELGANPNAYIMNRENADIIFGTNNNEKMRMKASGNIGIGTTNPHASAIVELNSTNAGFLLPRMTGAQRNAIPSPAEGLMVYVTDAARISYFNGTLWVNAQNFSPCPTC